VIGDEAFAGCSLLKEVVFSPSLKEIGQAAFAGCSLLEDFVFPEGLTLIKAHAFFKAASVTRLIIPTTVTHILQSAFEGCANLQTLHFSPVSHIALIGHRAFHGTSLTQIIPIPLPQQHKLILQNPCIQTQILPSPCPRPSPVSFS
jgi:hypothetical protein